MNVLAAPGEVFGEINRSKPATGNWFGPAILSVVAGLAFVLIFFSQDAILHQLREAQSKGIEQQVAAKKLTREQANQAEQFMDKMGPLITKVGGGIMVVASSFAVPFWWGLILWLIGCKALKGSFTYMKAVEMAGIASVVYALGTVITLLLGLSLGRLACGPSLGLLLTDADFTKKTHVALIAVNVIYLWYAILMAVALSILRGVSFGKAVGWILGFWIVSRAILILTGLGQFVM